MTTSNWQKQRPTSWPLMLAREVVLIDELSKVDQSTDPRTPNSRQHGGGYYRTSLDDARRARVQAEAMGKDFSIAALIWMQGEANGGPSGGIVPARWKKELNRPVGQQWYRDRADRLPQKMV